MTPLAILPCWLIVRPHKGMGVNELHPDTELDRIALQNEIARNEQQRRARQVPSR